MHWTALLFLPYTITIVNNKRSYWQSGYYNSYDFYGNICEIGYKCGKEYKTRNHLSKIKIVTQEHNIEREIINNGKIIAMRNKQKSIMKRNWLEIKKLTFWNHFKY